MAKDNKTIFQRLSSIITSNTGQHNVQQYNISPKNNEVLYTYSSKEERDKKLLQLRQQKMLAHQWANMGMATKTEQLVGLNQVKVMYRDADMMAAWPEIRTALLMMSEEATVLNKNGKMLNIFSKSDRIASVLEDLFVNRLDLHIMLPLIAYDTCKYGNEFMHLNIDDKQGVIGWRQLPIHEMTRQENGIGISMNGTIAYQASNNRDNEVQFIWEGHNELIPLKNWQVAHFRLITDSLLMPYGTSYLNSARRHWRMLSMMEDAMLLYRLERSIERRVFKVNVGLIDDADVPAFLQDFFNNIKRAPIIDPETGQVDLRKNFLDVSADYVIPVRNGQDPTSIETLAGAQNQTSMEDIEYIQTKIFTALRIPKAYLNFKDAEGKGQNLSLQDIRFSRAVNGVQQAMLLELNKIAMIHLYMLGFKDDITNFTLTLNNPSNQIEMMALDAMQKRITNASQALSEQGGGIPIMSWHKVQKEIMGLSDVEITDMLNEIRLETAIANELQLTTQIIKKTGLFKRVDRIFGEPGADYQNSGEQGQANEGGFGGGGGMPPMGGGDFGNDLGDLGDLGDISGGPEGSSEKGEMDLGDMDNYGAPTESIHKPNNREILSERLNNAIDSYIKNINEKSKDNVPSNVSIIDKNILINEDLTSAITGLENEYNKNNIND